MVAILLHNDGSHCCYCSSVSCTCMEEERYGHRATDVSYTEMESSDVPNAKESGGEEERDPSPSLQPQSYEPSQVIHHSLSVLSFSIPFSFPLIPLPHSPAFSFSLLFSLFLCPFLPPLSLFPSFHSINQSCLAPFPVECWKRSCNILFRTRLGLCSCVD